MKKLATIAATAAVVLVSASAAQAQAVPCNRGYVQIGNARVWVNQIETHNLPRVLYGESRCSLANGFVAREVTDFYANGQHADGSIKLISSGRWWAVRARYAGNSNQWLFTIRRGNSWAITFAFAA
jgi:hypothetical protein